jgi:hypothetical protein
MKRKHEPFADDVGDGDDINRGSGTKRQMQTKSTFDKEFKQQNTSIDFDANNSFTISIYKSVRVSSKVTNQTTAYDRIVRANVFG